MGVYDYILLQSDLNAFVELLNLVLKDRRKTTLLIAFTGVLLSVGIMMSGVIDPLLSVFRIISNQNDSLISIIGSFLGQGALYILIAYFSSIIIIVIGVAIYTNLTPIDKFKEIKNNNIGVTIIVCVIIVTLTLMCKDGVVLLIESIVPYPELSPR